jgi:glutathione S-transferase
MKYELVTLPFPPRVHAKEYLQVNKLGTIPYLEDGSVALTESVAICEYLLEKHYATSTLRVLPSEDDFAAYKNFIHQSDATFTFPMALMLRYGVFEKHRNLGVIATDYEKWVRKKKLPIIIIAVFSYHHYCLSLEAGF